MGSLDAVSANADVKQWRRLVAYVRDEVGEPRGVRILHLTDVHNRPSALIASNVLAESIEIDVTVNTGDMSGLPWPLESMFVSGFLRIVGPYVFVPGNHDGERTARMFRNKGAFVLDEPQVADVVGLRIWGFADPNKTRFGRGDDYSVALSRKSATTSGPPEPPTIVAVHSEEMIRKKTGITLVLCGHNHVPKAQVIGDTVVLRPGSSGGGGPLGKDLRFGVVDVEPDSLGVVAAWFIALGSEAHVTKVI